MTLKGHSDTITGLRVSPDGSHLLSNSMDNTLREWDMRPYAPANRCTQVYTGAGGGGAVEGGMEGWSGEACVHHACVLVPGRWPSRPRCMQACLAQASWRGKWRNAP